MVPIGFMAVSSTFLLEYVIYNEFTYNNSIYTGLLTKNATTPTTIYPDILVYTNNDYPYRLVYTSIDYPDTLVNTNIYYLDTLVYIY